MSKENDKNFEFKEYPKYFGYIVSETHWDREWYLTFKEFQKWLVRLIDKLIDGLKDHPNFVSFMLDGQTCPIEDYLQIRPYNETKIKELVKDKRLVIGPFYVLADEFLESGEAMIRNLLLGHKIGKKFGHTMKVGYVPDTFGHIWQLPQILKGFGIKYATAYRGYPPLFGNHEEWKGHNDNTPLEFYWQAPDGSSSIIMYHLLRGYGNAVDICQNPVVIDGNKVFVQGISRISDTWHAIKERQLTPIQLYLNGSDHKEAELDLPEFVEFFNNEEDIQEELNLELKHSTLENYFEDLEKLISRFSAKLPRSPTKTIHVDRISPDPRSGLHGSIHPDPHKTLMDRRSSIRVENHKELTTLIHPRKWVKGSPSHVDKTGVGSERKMRDQDLINKKHKHKTDIIE